MKACDACAGVRAVLADAFRILASGTAFWFVVNSEDHYNENFSLCSRLGLTARDYEALLVGAQLATYDKHGLFKISAAQWVLYLKGNKIRFDKKRTDLSAPVEGRRVDAAKVLTQ